MFPGDVRTLEPMRNYRRIETNEPRLMINELIRSRVSVAATGWLDGRRETGVSNTALLPVIKPPEK